MTISSEEGDALSAYYVVSNSELTTTSEIFQASGKYVFGEHWKMNGNINYDITQQATQQVSIGLAYTHPCWELGIETHSNKRPSGGTTEARDIGASILIAFTGLGSVGTNAR
ncbi:MAG: hypothetical protein Q9M23_06600 [Mariprofundaceae bacterium]|nr:hypothetical protein [Mariprofundaceae bacterium]